MQSVPTLMTSHASYCICWYLCSLLSNHKLKIHQDQCSMRNCNLKLLQWIQRLQYTTAISHVMTTWKSKSWRFAIYETMFFSSSIMQLITYTNLIQMSVLKDLAEKLLRNETLQKHSKFKCTLMKVESGCNKATRTVLCVYSQIT